MSVLDDIIAGPRRPERARGPFFSRVKEMEQSVPEAKDAWVSFATEMALSRSFPRKRSTPSAGRSPISPDPAALASMYEAGDFGLVLTEQRRFHLLAGRPDAVRGGR